MCIRNRIYTPSYPIDSMTLSQLQSAALGPYTFARIIHDNSAPLGLERSAQHLTPVSAISIPPRLVFEIPSQECRTYLIPGGRYLLILNPENSKLGLWDLGPPGHALQKPSLVAELDTTRDHQPGRHTFGPNQIEACMDAPGKSVLRVATVTSRGGLVCVFSQPNYSEP